VQDMLEFAIFDVVVHKVV